MCTGVTIFSLGGLIIWSWKCLRYNFLLGLPVPATLTSFGPGGLSVQTKKCRERDKQEIQVGRLTNGHGHVISALVLKAHECARGHGGGGGGETNRDRHTAREEGEADKDRQLHREDGETDTERETDREKR